MNPFDRLREEGGQALAIVAIAMTTLLLAIGLTIDGGNAFAQQRATQNGSDAASLAGAVKLGNYAACSVWSCAAPTDAEVKAAVMGAAAQNAIVLLSDPANSNSPINAWYTDVCGQPLTTAGLKAASSLSNAARVGNGLIPPDVGGTANCASGDTGPARGVLVKGHRSVGTFMIGMVGINTWEIETPSTAVSTYGACASSQGCGALPIAFPVNITSCDGSGNAVDSMSPWLLDTYYIFPLCKKAPGNVGWLDLNGRSVAGLADQVLHPANSPLNSPQWWDDPITGNTNTKGVEDALRTLDGHTVRALQYNHTCSGSTNSSFPTINTGPNYGCASGLDDGNGTHNSYRLTALGFTLCDPTNVDCPLPHGSYTNGNNSNVCGTGNGSTGCIVGKFVSLDQVPGAGVGGSGDTSPVQLIK